MRIDLYDLFLYLYCIYFHRCVCAINIIFVIIGSIYTNIKSRLYAAKKRNSAVKCNGHTIEMNNKQNNVNNTGDTQHTRKTRHRPQTPFIDRFFSCFSMAKNSAIITTNSLGNDSIEVIHGMRLYNIYQFTFCWDTKITGFIVLLYFTEQ